MSYFLGQVVQTVVTLLNYAQIGIRDSYVFFYHKGMFKSPRRWSYNIELKHSTNEEREPLSSQLETKQHTSIKLNYSKSYFLKAAYLC